MKKQIRLKVQGEEFTVNVERSGDSIEIERDGRVYTVQVLADPNAPVPTVRRASTQPPSGSAAPAPKAQAKPAVTAAAGSVTAPMTGTIKQVLVAVGDVVKEGNFVMIMEAMKMDMEISAPQAGTVGQILCKVGDSVKEHQPLLTIE